MAYNEIFFATYVDTPPQGDVPAQYRISFLLDNYAGTTTELLPYEKSPCKLSVSLGNESVFEPIRPTKAMFALQATSVAQAEAFYVVRDQQMQVILSVDYTGGTTYSDTVFTGFTLPTDFNYDYKKPPFQINITAACGLSLLKDRPLLDATGTRLKNQVSISHALRTILARTGNNLPLETGVNLFELAQVAVGQTIDGKVKPETCPLYEALLYADTFVKGSAVQSGYDALKRLLEPYNLCVVQNRGAWRVMRVPEMGGGWDVWNAGQKTIHTRTYTSSDLAAGPVSHASVDLNRYAYINTNLSVKKSSSPRVGLQNIKPGVRIEQNFGTFKDILGNGDFGLVDNTGLPLGWVRKNISNPAKVIKLGTGTEEDPNRVRIYGSDYEGYIENQTQGIFQQIHFDSGTAAFAKNLKTTRKLTFRFRLFNARGAKVVIRSSFEAPLNPWSILTEGGTWLPMPKPAERKGILILHDIQVGSQRKEKPGWCDASISIGPKQMNELNILFSKPYTLETYDSNGAVTGPVTSPEPWIEIADVKLVEESENLNINGIQRTIVQTNRTAETLRSLTLGNVPIAAGQNDRLGGFYTRSSNGVVPMANVYRPDQAIGPSGENGSAGRLLIDYLTDEFARQYMLTAGSFEGEFYGRLPDGPLTVLRVSDITPTANYNPDTAIPHVFTQWEFDTRAVTHRVTGIELNTAKATPTGTGITQTPEWKTDSGDILISNDPATGLPIAPTLPVTPSRQEQIALDLKGLGLPSRIPKLTPYFPGFMPLQASNNPRPVLVLRATPTTPEIKLKPGFQTILKLKNL